MEKNKEERRRSSEVRNTEKTQADTSGQKVNNQKLQKKEKEMGSIDGGTQCNLLYKI